MDNIPHNGEKLYCSAIICNSCRIKQIRSRETTNFITTDAFFTEQQGDQHLKETSIFCLIPKKVHPPCSFLFTEIGGGWESKNVSEFTFYSK